MMKEITIITPKPAEGALVELTEYLSEKLSLDGGNGLGGANGYGVEYENDTFMMHPFCWCERDDCAWCTWETDSDRAANFLYKPTGTKVWWYKWIGRGQEQKGELPVDWLEKCKQSVKPARPAAEGDGDD